MTFPKSNIWQEIRSNVLDLFPEGCGASYSNPVSLAKWRESGSYTFLGASKKKVDLECSKQELAESLLTDVEFILDKTIELETYIISSIKNPWVSPTWLIVKVYYFAFFSAIGIERLLGDAVFFMNKDFYKALQILSNPTKLEIGSGTFTLSKGSDVSASHCTIGLEKSTDGFHETVWEKLFKLISEFVKKHKESADSNEIRMFNALLGNKAYPNMKWISEFRNKINYRTDSELSEVRKNSFNEYKTIIADSYALNSSKKVDQIESILLGGFEPNLESFRNILASSRHLTTTSFLLNSIFKEIYLELVSRRKLDKRWSMRREKFLEKAAI